ncbi:Na+/H+ antiporter subunit E [Fuchsiella alkaliacetigena]|uniref:Na+/H+ antiporter subunit E n=1 Tax=Fuchsiella alkaliacetigena TaxID=957042 RepID=UPI00200A61D2|nr:Na+/H+ antiporter subunit E [Fuchsiella alkaliacetigena]MCK8825631.1 Na+/H+ antiporter subunit E [Fuchsiella alkaliacetigena]
MDEPMEEYMEQYVDESGRIYLFLILFAGWFVISAEFTVVSAIVGGVIAFIPAFLTKDYFVKFATIRLVTRLFTATTFMLLLIKQVLLASLKVSYLILHPQMSFNHGIVKVPTKFAGKNKEIAMSILGNTVTLTPGTMTVDLNVDSGDLYIHWIDIESREPAKMRELIYGKFENLIGRIFI